MADIVEYAQVNDSNRSKAAPLAEAFSAQVKAKVSFRHVTHGYEPAGSCARWTDGYYSVRWQDRSGAFQGRRYALTQEGKAQAEAHFAKLTAPGADGPGPSAQ